MDVVSEVISTLREMGVLIDTAVVSMAFYPNVIIRLGYGDAKVEITVDNDKYSVEAGPNYDLASPVTDPKRRPLPFKVFAYGSTLRDAINMLRKEVINLYVRASKELYSIETFTYEMRSMFYADISDELSATRTAIWDLVTFMNLKDDAKRALANS